MGTEQEIVYQPHLGPQTEFHERIEDFALYGGAKGGGKTQALLFEATRQVDNPGYKALIIRRTFPRLQEMIDRAKEKFSKLGAKWEGQEHRFIFPSGSMITFGHCENEDSKYNYQGHEFAFIGFDQLEEFTESQFNFLLAQNRTSNATVKCYVRATANPGGVGHWWIKRRFIDGKTPKKRYEESFILLDGKQLIRSSTYIPAKVYDNPTLLKANPNYLAILMGLPEAERLAFLEGDWNAFTTQCVFDREGMLAQEGRIEDPAWTGKLVDYGDGVNFEVDPHGFLQIFRRPDARSRYCIFADPAYGKTSGDYSPAGVFRYGSNELVALWYGKAEPTEWGKTLYGLGMYYNWAKIAVEVRPGPGIATVGKLVDLGYPKLYKRMVWDGEVHKEAEEIGWVTDERSRHEMISAGKEAILTKSAIIRSRVMLDEHYNFIRNRLGREEARESCHDDCVIVFCGAMRVMDFDPVGETAEDKPQRSFLVTGGARPPKRHGAFNRDRQFAGAVRI